MTQAARRNIRLPASHDPSPILVPVVMRESLVCDALAEPEAGAVARRLGKNVSQPHVKASKRGNYANYYDDESMRIVESWFGTDIENSGYEFAGTEPSQP